MSTARSISGSAPISRRRSAPAAPAASAVGAGVVPAAVTALIVAFLVSLIIPLILNLGPLRLSVYRLVLLAAIGPLVLAWLSGRFGKILTVDILVLLACVWAAMALFYNHGIFTRFTTHQGHTTQGLQPAVVFFIETFGAYLLARALVWNQASFERFANIFVIIIWALLPIALVESVFNIMLLSEIFDVLGKVILDAHRPTRWGLERVQGPFEHPILFGVFCSAAFSLAFFVGRHRSGFIASCFRALGPFLCTILSLSVGAFVSVLTQGLLLVWSIVLRPIPVRWQILTFLILAAYIIVDLISDRSPVEVFISYATFNSGNAYNRIHIWHFGTAEVLRHPLFGIGLHDWERGWWMGSSMDNMWLVFAVRYGLPGLLSFALAVFLILRGVSRARSSAPGFEDCQNAFLFAVIGICVSICTVHLWNAAFCFLMFLLGTGVWMTRPQPAVGADQTPAQSDPAPGRDPAASPLGQAERLRPTRGYALVRRIAQAQGAPRATGRGFARSGARADEAQPRGLARGSTRGGRK